MPVWSWHIVGLIVERFTRRADGEREVVIARSMSVIAEIRVHAGISKRFSFDTP